MVVTLIDRRTCIISSVWNPVLRTYYNMSDIAIRVEHLGKKYQLGGQQARYATFRESLVNTAKAPCNWLKGERRAAKGRILGFG